jgi:hypothetical protein
MCEAPGSDEDRKAARAAAALSRPGAYVEAVGNAYRLRIDADRRRRPLMAFDEAIFLRLVREPGLKPHGRGGWIAAHPVSPPSPPPGRPSVTLGERTVMEPDGARVVRAANLGESPIAWLARRRDAKGRPWLTTAEAAAGERLRDDFHRAGTVGRLTMDWSGMPRSGSGGGARLDPAERARAAKARVASALEAAGPGLREILERICFRGSALDAAERSLGLPRRSGKAVLKLALGRLARHYGLA